MSRSSILCVVSKHLNSVIHCQVQCLCAHIARQNDYVNGPDMYRNWITGYLESAFDLPFLVLRQRKSGRTKWTSWLGFPDCLHLRITNSHGIDYVGWTGHFVPLGKIQLHEAYQNQGMTEKGNVLCVSSKQFGMHGDNSNASLTYEFMWKCERYI